MECEYAPIGFIYLGGLICASYMGVFPSLVFVCALLAASVPLFLLKKKRELLYVGILCAAILAFVLYSLLFIEPVRRLSGTSALVTGTVIECGRADNDTVRLVISGESNGVPIKLVLYAQDPGAAAGDSISFTAVFSDFSDSADFEETQYYFSKGIFIKARAANTPVIAEAGGLKFFTLPGAFSSYLRERVRSVLGGDEGELLCAMFFGDRSGLSSELSVCLKRAGLSHMTAVSGMHLSLIVNTAAAFIRLLPKNYVLTRFSMTAGLIILLALFFGMSASVLRSGGMLLLYYAAEPLRRKSSPAHTLGFSAMAITVVEPYACRDIGLWLSILGTFGSAVAAPELSERFIKRNRFKRLKSSLMTSVCAAVCTFPAGALCFGGVSLISAASALMVYPMFFVSLIFLLGMAVTGGLFAEAFLLPAGLAVKGMIFITRALGQLSLSFVRLDGWIYPALVALASAGAVVIFLFTCRLRYSARFLVPVVCVMLTAASVQSAAEQGSTVISVYSDGSDALVVIESDSCVSAISMSDSAKIGRQLFEHTVGSRVGLICVMNTEENNLGELSLCRPEKLHLPQTENALYDISGEYTVATEDGAFTVNVRGVSIAVLPAGSETDADFAVFSGYGGKLRKSGAKTAGTAGTEIFCDKRYRDGGTANAYYDKITITVSAGGEAVFRREGGAA